MEGNMAFRVVMLILVGGMVLAAFTLFNSGRQFSQGIDNQSDSWNLDEVESQRGGFSVHGIRYSPAYPDENVSLCNDTHGEAVLVLEVYLKISDLPQNCDVYFDNKLTKDIDLTDMYCATCEKDEELVESVASSALDRGKSHYLEVCCDGYCIVRSIPPACS